LAQTLILDSEALAALAFARQRGVLGQRAVAVLEVAHEKQAKVRVPAPVLAEVCRGSARDAAVDLALQGRGIHVVDLTRTMARMAGALLSRAKMGSAHAVDAFVVATAASFESAVIATHDPDDLERLASGVAHVQIFTI
jgi:predicted nucleic acid-binding protein